jgi:hypothetical protein
MKLPAAISRFVSKPAMPGQIIGPYLVLGEGDRDKLFIEGLCQNRGITGLTVDFVKGNDRFGGHLTGLTAAQEFKKCRAILLVSDIDESATDSFRNIKQQLMDEGFPVPNSPLSMAQKQDFPNLAVLMIPHPVPASDPRGSLETLITPAIETLFAPQASCVSTMLNCANVTSWGKKSSQDKARVRCLTSAVCEDNPMIGLQLCFDPKKKLIDLGHNCLNEVALVLQHFPTWSRSAQKEWTDWRKSAGV